MHGARAGAPRGNRNAFKHGEYSAAVIAERRALRALMEEVGEMLEGLDGG